MLYIISIFCLSLIMIFSYKSLKKDTKIKKELNKKNKNSFEKKIKEKFLTNKD